jgi:Predicted transcriptional regulators
MSSLSTDQSNIAIGQRLMAVRAASQLTQVDFAARLGLSPRAYANYERGEREMPVALFKLLCDVFLIDPLWVLTGPGDVPMHIGNRRIDVDLLEKVIVMIDGWLTKHRRKMEPAKRARAIRIAYEQCVLRGRADPDYVGDMLSLAA